MESIRLAVAGAPIGHSLSPYIFSRLFAQLGIAGEYTRIEEDGSRALVQLFSEYGLVGLNLTSPLKRVYVAQMDSLSPVAGSLGAVNAVVRMRGGGLHGDNFDVVGIAQAMEYLGIDVRGRQVLLLGAGGAASALLYRLTAAGARVWVVNRTEAHAAALIARIAPTTAHRGLPARLETGCLVCSTLPAGSEVPRLAWSRVGLIFDSVYAYSPLEPLAQEYGLARVGGLEWLYFQALAFFRALFGSESAAQVDHAALIAQLRGFAQQ